MAITSHRISYTLRDAERHESVQTVYASTTDERARALATALKPLVAALSDALIVNTEITIQDPNANVDVPEGNVDHEIQGKFAFYNSDNKVTTLTIPSFKREKLIPDQGRIDTTDTDVQAFLAAMLDGVDVTVDGTPTTVVLRDARGSLLLATKSALEAYGKKRKPKKNT